ncbi:MAG: hypothetical protein H6581_22430 [Bacteroidia bacterium]|nr:hypothetical protein [Bacteroidia bacterium]
MKKMKPFAALILLSLLVFSCGSSNGGDPEKKQETTPEETVQPNRTRPEGKKIAKMTEYKISPDDAEGTILNVEEYDANGFKLKYSSYNYYGSGELESSTVYKNDEKGNCLEMNDGKTKNTYKYDEKGRQIKAAWSRANGEGASEEMTYDDHDQLIETKYYDAKGKYDFSRTREISYDPQGRIIEEKKWEKYTDGTEPLMQYWKKYVFDDAGRQIESYSYREDGSETDKEVRKYDGAGNLVTVFSYEYGEKNPSYKEIRKYNQYGEVVADQTLSCDSETGDCSTNNFTNEYKYDEWGNKIWFMYNQDDGTAWGSRFVYEFH